jgi:hypothetical protein
VVMQTIFPNVIVQQQSNTLAMRQMVTRGPHAFDLNWTFFGFKTDSPELRQRRIRQASLMGPAGLVSVDMINRMTEIVLSGFYLDRIVRTGGRLRFKERLCIYDSLLLPTSLIAPV